MSLTFEYKVTGLKSRTQTNTEGASLSQAIVQTYWEAIGTDEHGHSAKFVGATPFSAENVPEGEFRPFSELSEADVIGWITAYIDSMPGYREHITDRINREIDQKFSDEKDDVLPWAPDEPVLNAPAPSLEEDPADADAAPADPDAP